MRCDLQFGDEKDVPNWSVCLFFLSCISRRPHEELQLGGLQIVLS